MVRKFVLETQRAGKGLKRPSGLALSVRDTWFTQTGAVFSLFKGSQKKGLLVFPLLHPKVVSP